MPRHILEYPRKSRRTRADVTSAQQPVSNPEWFVFKNTLAIVTPSPFFPYAMISSFVKNGSIRLLERNQYGAQWQEALSESGGESTIDVIAGDSLGGMSYPSWPTNAPWWLIEANVKEI